MYLACGLYLTLGREYGRARRCLLNYYRVQENITERVPEQELLIINWVPIRGIKVSFHA